MKTTVVYHSADFDGIFCREIARKFLHDAELIGWDFGNPPLEIPDGKIYVMDLPVDRVFGFDFTKPETQPRDLSHMTDLVWIDHHKSSIETHPASIPGYRIDGVAACRLAWQWFSMARGSKPHIPAGTWNWPNKEEYVDRKVSEPYAVRLAGEYDIWDKRDPDAELFQHGLKSEEVDWQRLLSASERERPDNDLEEAHKYASTLLKQGKALQYAQTKQNASIIKDIGFTFQWEGLTWLACNHARYNSFLFTAGLTPEHDACFGFKFTGHCAAGKSCEQWSISLYHAPGKEQHDLSLIAVKYKGGGHRGACGFQTDKLPFLP